MKVEVADPFGAGADPALPGLARALDPREMQERLARELAPSLRERSHPRLRAIRVTRHKPGRRCVLEYDLEVEGPHGAPETLTLVGKTRAGRSGGRAYRLLRALRRSGFDGDAADGICVPEPVAVLRDLCLWLQRKVPGCPATALLAAPGGEALAARIAEAAHKLHSAGVPARTSHGMADELRILRERLPPVAEGRPGWAPRIECLLRACERLGAALPEPAPRGIHRDFYPDQVLVEGSRLYLIDFDLYCAGNPGLDIGNFLGHVTEQSLRTMGNSNALGAVERAMVRRFAALAGPAVLPAVHTYAALTLVRHIHLSTLFADRRPFTAALLELCEERLAQRDPAMRVA